ncbi:MAG: hypothetical protein QM760_20785 [Nibricoccus sp.]
MITTVVSAFEVFADKFGRRVVARSMSLCKSRAARNTPGQSLSAATRVAGEPELTSGKAPGVSAVASSDASPMAAWVDVATHKQKRRKKRIMEARALMRVWGLDFGGMGIGDFYWGVMVQISLLIERRHLSIRR